MLAGWLLKIGQALIVPILIALISVYILVEAADKLRCVPYLGYSPEWLRRLVVLMGFIGVLVLFAWVVIATGEQMMSESVKYQSNLEGLIARVATSLKLDSIPDWQSIRNATLDKIDIQLVLSGVLNSLSSLLGIATMVAIYAVFLLGERGSFDHKLSIAFSGRSAKRTQEIINDVNRKIGAYLATKTLINVVVGVLSWAVMWWFDVDFSIFWALVIALLNYIPYVGSFLGVVFPVVLSLAQFGSAQTTIWLAIWLSAVQFYVSNILEPRLIGKGVNLSPFVVMVALSLWSAMWGVVGAVLAIPLTSMIAIICATLPATRPIAVLLADSVGEYEALETGDET